jgi:hypothetical protein
MPSSLTQFANAAGLDLGIMDSGGAFSGQQYLDILAKANRILDNWSSEQIQVPFAGLAAEALTAGNSQYNVGAAQAWPVSPAPLKIVSATLLMNNGVQLPMEVVSASKWDTLPDRGASSNLVRYLFYTPAPGGLILTGVAQVSPVPQANGGFVSFQFWRAFTQFADIATAILFPPGYELAFQLELALAIAPMFDETPSAELEAAYGKAMNALRKLNAELWGIESLAPEQAAVKATE